MSLAINLSIRKLSYSLVQCSGVRQGLSTTISCIETTATRLSRSGCSKSSTT
ncbi:Uncharacterised protein [Vibrio cholerae]|nr:Uncharacterised protein [Vibrio cholerae]